MLTVRLTLAEGMTGAAASRWCRSRDTIDEDLTTCDNIIDIRINRVF